MKYVFDIKLDGLSEPEVWRKIAVPGEISFLRFHKIIQIVFGWENIHFFKFYTDCNENIICMPLEDEAGPVNFADATNTKIDDIFSKGISTLRYLYDRNDQWMHTITLEQSSSDNIKYPACLAGCGMCPPEGCGGAERYEHIKDILRNKPESEEARRCREWLFIDDGTDFDPFLFDEEEIEDINAFLSRHYVVY